VSGGRAPTTDTPAPTSPVTGSAGGPTDPAGHDDAAWIARARAGFAEVYGRDPVGVWFAPGRVNLIGEHTDYNDGFVLPLALPQGTVVAAGPHQPLGDEGASSSRAVSTAESTPVTYVAATVAPGDVDGWGAYVAGTVWALRTAEPAVAVIDLDLWVDSDVPYGAGLSSSAALECAVAVLVTDLAADPPGPDAGAAAPDLDRLALALAAKRAENDFVGAPTGYMDQMASMLGEEGAALFIDTRSLECTPVPFDLAAAGLVLLVVDSRAVHHHADGEYAARRRSCEQAVAELGVRALRDVEVADLDAALARLSSDELRRRVRHIVTEDARVLAAVEILREHATGPAGLRAVGPLLTASHDSMRDDFEITVPEVDVLVTAAVAAGAHGARMTGGGFGGCVIALVDTDAADEVAAAMVAAALAAGHREPAVYRARAAGGARRLD